MTISTESEKGQTDPKEAIISYWGRRSEEFAKLRRKELVSRQSERWMAEILPFIPADKKHTKILDIGTGSGFFSILLAKEGYEQVTGIDLTPEMIQEARETAELYGCTAQFQVMDAEHPQFPEEFFDVLLTRNLTWTLPHLPEAYQQWYRLLKKGGILLNFDADYGNDEEDEIELPSQHAHKNLTPELHRDHERIMAMLPNTFMRRPGADMEMLKAAGFDRVTVDFCLSGRIYQEIDEFYNPVRMFALRAVK